MPVLTTNADINVGDSINYIMNIFGAVNLTPQVPLPMLFNGNDGSNQTPPFVAQRYPQSYPAISEIQNELNFTITNPKTITNITTSIHNPDGSFAQLNRDSCIIYKLNQHINSIFNPVDELLQKSNKK